MEQYYDQMRMIIQLIDTGKESLDYLLKRIDEVMLQNQNDSSEPISYLNYKVPLYLISDLAQSYMSINRSLDEFIDKLPPNNIVETADTAASSINDIVDDVNHANLPMVKDGIEKYLLPAHLLWRQEITQCFNQFILC